MEDALKLQQGDDVMMYFRTNADNVVKNWHQLETLLQKCPYSRFEEIRRNRMVRRQRYPSGHGKHDLTMYECLELANRFFSQFPKVRTLEAFARQGNYVGLAIMCKRFVLVINSLSDKGDDKVYHSGSKPKCKPEKTIYMQYFQILGLERW